MPRFTDNYQKREEAKKDFFLETLKGTRLYFHFRLLTSRTMREYISVFQSHQFCGIFLQQPQKMDILSYIFLLRYSWYAILYVSGMQQWVTIFKGYTLFIIIIKHWLYSLWCVIYPCNLLIWYIGVCTS